jgi:hypothetical protein
VSILAFCQNGLGLSASDRKQDGNIVADCGSQYKEVPDCVVAWDFFVKIENTANGVKRTACCDQDQYGGWKSFEKLSAAYKQKPAHGNVNYRAKNCQAACKKNLKDNAKKNQRPLYCKKRYAKGIQHIDKQKGRVGSGNSKINRDMVAYPQHFFYIFVLRTVVKRTTREQQ